MNRLIKSRILLVIILSLVVLSLISCADPDTSTIENNESNTQSTETKYIGSAHSDKYHKPSCRYVENIKSSNLIEFISKEDAENKGYKPCSVCKP